MSSSPQPWGPGGPEGPAPQFREQSRRDPRQPFGQPATPPTQPQFPPSPQPQRDRSDNRMLWLIGAVAMVVAVVIALQFLGGTNDGETYDPETPPSISYDPSGAATANDSIPFEGNGTGVLKITNARKEGSNLVVDFTIELDEGSHRYGVFLFDNTTMQTIDPSSGGNFEATAGYPYQGSATFTVPAELTDATFTLTSSAGRAVAALPVQA